MAKGGARPGAGRKAGSATKRTRQIADAAAAEGITPLEFMLRIMRSAPPDEATALEKATWLGMQFEAAKQAAPYVHPKLSSVSSQATVNGTMALRIVSEFPDADDVADLTS